MSFLFNILNNKFLRKINLHVYILKLLRNSTMLSPPYHRTNYGKKSVFSSICSDANLLCDSIDDNVNSVTQFKLALKNLLGIKS